MDFTAIRNLHESRVIETVIAQARAWPAVAQDEGLLADVACVALNRVPPHYIRHVADHAFYATEAQKHADAKALAEAVTYAFGYVQARHAMAARR